MYNKEGTPGLCLSFLGTAELGFSLPAPRQSACTLSAEQGDCPWHFPSHVRGSCASSQSPFWPRYCHALAKDRVTVLVCTHHWLLAGPPCVSWLFPHPRISMCPCLVVRRHGTYADTHTHRRETHANGMVLWITLIILMSPLSHWKRKILAVEVKSLELSLLIGLLSQKNKRQFSDQGPLNPSTSILGLIFAFSICFLTAMLGLVYLMPLLTMGLKCSLGVDLSYSSGLKALTTFSLVVGLFWEAA